MKYVIREIEPSGCYVYMDCSIKGLQYTWREDVNMSTRFDLDEATQIFRSMKCRTTSISPYNVEVVRFIMSS